MAVVVYDSFGQAVRHNEAKPNVSVVKIGCCY